VVRRLLTVEEDGRGPGLLGIVLEGYFLVCDRRSFLRGGLAGTPHDAEHGQNPCEDGIAKPARHIGSPCARSWSGDTPNSWRAGSRNIERWQKNILGRAPPPLNPEQIETLRSLGYIR
jgi:hypothetical protein